MTSNTDNQTVLSERGFNGCMVSNRATCGTNSNPLFKLMCAVLSDGYDVKSNPDGIISLGVAENYLSHDIISNFFSKNSQCLTSMLTYGTGFSGSPELKLALASFYKKYFKARDISAENILIGNGCTSLLDLLAFALCDSGDGILIAKPLYGGFCNDLSGRANVEVVDVELDSLDEMFVESAIAKYEAAMDKAEKNGVSVKALILCQPHNPLGKCYSEEVIKKYMAFCQRRKIHLISDEIYGLSTFERPGAIPFVSALSIDTNGLIDANKVHVVHGASKDFCANGLRIAACITRSDEVMKTIGNVCMFTSASSFSQHLWLSILNDTEFLESYISTNREKLGRAYERCTKILEEHKIPFYRGGNAGFFVYVDLSQYLPPRRPGQKEEVERERELTENMLKSGIYLSPGEVMMAPAGVYRLTFSVPEDILDKGLER